jgi:hypothetical protein
MKEQTIWGLSDSDGNLVKLNLSTQPFGLFTTKNEADRYIVIHNTAAHAVKIELP